MAKMLNTTLLLGFLITCSLYQARAADVVDAYSGVSYAATQTFTGTVRTTVWVVGSVTAWTLSPNAIVEVNCAHDLTIPTLTMGKGASISFIGPGLALVGTTAIALDSTGTATFSFAKGGLTLDNKPTNMSDKTVFEYLSDGSILTCNNGAAAWTCEMRMTAAGVFTNANCTSLAGLISGTGALTLPATCAAITSTGSGRSSTDGSIVFQGNASFTDANIFSSGTLTLLYNLSYAGVASPPAPAKGSNKVYANQLPCSEVILGASATIDGGNGLTIKKLTDTVSFNPTTAGTLTINEYNPLGTNMTVSSGTTTIKKGEVNASFQIHRGGTSVIKFGS